MHLARAVARNPIGASVRRIESDDCSTSSMISNLSDHGKPFYPGINETTSRPTAADPYRLADP